MLRQFDDAVSSMPHTVSAPCFHRSCWGAGDSGLWIRDFETREPGPGTRELTRSLHPITQRPSKSMRAGTLPAVVRIDVAAVLTRERRALSCIALNVASRR